MDFGLFFEGFWVDFGFIFRSSSYSKRLKLANDMFYNFGIFRLVLGSFLVHLQSTSVVMQRGTGGCRRRRRRSGRAPSGASMAVSRKH